MLRRRIHFGGKQVSAITGWEYTYPACAGKFLDGWCTRAMRGQIEPMKSMAHKLITRTLRKKRELLLNWFHAGGTLSSGVVEGFNNKLKLITRKSYGFRTQNAYETALYHTLGALPEPQFTHRFFRRGEPSGRSRRRIQFLEENHSS
jgi:transposase